MIPEHLKIGFEVYRVSIGTADFELQGECNIEHGTIVLTRKATPRRSVATLIHEILHACWDQAELEDHADDAKEEQIINRLAPVLTAVLLDNPGLRACLEAAAQNANSTCWREDNEQRKERKPHCPYQLTGCTHEKACEYLRSCVVGAVGFEPTTPAV